MGKKTFMVEELSDLSAEEIIFKIQHDDYSLLTSLGAENLRQEMVKVGQVCHSAISFFWNTTGPREDVEKHAAAARRKLVKVLSKFTPGSYEGFPTDSLNGLVVGFNHPSLGEIPRILMMKIDLMGNKPMLFPVNLPWYEALAPDYARLKALGIIITPTITPSTWEKMNLVEGSELYVAGKRIKREFRDLYKKLSHEIIHDGGVIFVAPSATRQATVFKTRGVYAREEEIIPTMSVLALDLLSDPEIKCDFLPMAVLPPVDYKRGLNFWKKYRLIPGELMHASEIRKKYFKGAKKPKRLENFDWDFHARIAEKLPPEFLQPVE